MIKEIIYPAVFEFDEEGAINITFPDLPSAISCADNTQDAYRYSTEAAELVLEDYIEDLFEGAPKPSEIKNINLEENQCIALIKIDIEKVVKESSSKSVKKTVTIPSWLNEAGMKKKLNFSKILQDGIKKELGI